MNEKTPLTRLLILDDDGDFRRLLRRFLGTLLPDVEVEEYDPVAQGVPDEGFDWSRFDVLILDYYLCIHNVTGLDILQRNRKNRFFPATVMLTGAGNEEIAVRAIKAGVYDYLRKEKLDKEDLKNAILDAHEKHRVERQRLLEQTSQSRAFNKALFYQELEQPQGDRRRVLLILELDDRENLEQRLGVILVDNILRHIARSSFEVFQMGDCHPSVTRLSDSAVAMLIDDPGSDKTLGFNLAGVCKELKRRPYKFDDRKFRFSVSIGAVAVPADGGPAEALIRRARNACDLAAAEGGNSFHVDGRGTPAPTPEREAAPPDTAPAADASPPTPATEPPQVEPAAAPAEPDTVPELSPAAATRADTPQGGAPVPDIEMDIDLDSGATGGADARTVELTRFDYAPAGEAPAERAPENDEPCAETGAEPVQPGAAAAEDAPVPDPAAIPDHGRAPAAPDVPAPEPETPGGDSTPEPAAEASPPAPERERPGPAPAAAPAATPDQSERRTRARPEEEPDDADLSGAELTPAALRIKKAFDEKRVFQAYQPVISLFAPGDDEPAVYRVRLQLLDTDGKLQEEDRIYADADTPAFLKYIDRWILRDTLGRIVASHNGNTVFVLRISDASLADPGLFNWLRRILDGIEGRHPGKSIILEIAAGDFPAVRKKAAALISYLHGSHGFRFMLAQARTAEELKALADPRQFHLVQVGAGLLPELQQAAPDADAGSLLQVLKSRGTRLVIDAIADSTMLTTAIAAGADYAMGDFIGEPVQQFDDSTNVESFELT